MDILSSVDLIRRDKKHFKLDVISNSEFVGLLFAAQWSGASREFTILLASVVEELRRAGKTLSIILVSLDRSEKEMMELLVDSRENWLAVPFESHARTELAERFDVVQPPSLIILGKQGEVVSLFGRDYIEIEGANVWDRWIRQQIESNQESKD